jgi:hypothetical protein
MKIEIKKKELTGGLLPAGDHIGVIHSAAVTLSKVNAQWKDRTHMLEIIIKNAVGCAYAWLNLDAFKNSTDCNGVAPKGMRFASFNADSEKFLVDGKGFRVKDQTKIDKLAENIANLAFSVGEEGELDSEALVAYATELCDSLLGKKVGFRIKDNADGKTETTYFMTVDEVESVQVAD